MIIPDLNLLIYCYNADSPLQPEAAQWWEDCLNGSEEIGLVSVVVFGFIRISTQPRLFKNPFSISEASDIVRKWLRNRNVRFIEPNPTHIEEVFALLENNVKAGNLTTDAQIAALALQEVACVHSHDTDFRSFPGLDCHYPLR